MSAPYNTDIELDVGRGAGPSPEDQRAARRRRVRRDRDGRARSALRVPRCARRRAVPLPAATNRGRDGTDDRRRARAQRDLGMKAQKLMPRVSMAARGLPSAVPRLVRRSTPALSPKQPLGARHLKDESGRRVGPSSARAYGDDDPCRQSTDHPSASRRSSESYSASSGSWPLSIGDPAIRACSLWAGPLASGSMRRVTSSPPRRRRSRGSPRRDKRTRRSAPSCSSARALSSTTCARCSPSSTLAPASSSAARSAVAAPTAPRDATRASDGRNPRRVGAG
jgi:hypothetical protein